MKITRFDEKPWKKLVFPEKGAVFVIVRGPGPKQTLEVTRPAMRYNVTRYR